MVVNSTGQKVTLDMPAEANPPGVSPAIAQGDIIKITEQAIGGFPGIVDDFEVPDPSDATLPYGWVHNNVGTGTDIIAANNAHSGNNSLQLTNPSTGNYGGVYRKQGIAIPFTGGTLNLSIWAKGSAGGTTGPFRITFANSGMAIDDNGVANQQPSAQLGVSVSDRNLTVTTSYQQFTDSIAIPAGYTWAFVEFYAAAAGTPATLYEDTLAISIVPVDPGVLYTGIVEDLPDNIDQTVQHQIVLSPLGIELGDTDFTQNYSSATDIGQMIRDAVARCIHCTATVSTVPNTGLTRIFNFNETNVLTVLQTAAKMAGANYIWFVDELGQVWFGSTSAGTTYSAKTRIEAPVRKLTAPITGLKNYIEGFGAVIPNTDGVRVHAIYDGTAGSPYGRRALIPPIHFPNLTDQPTLQAIVNTLGSALNQIQTTIVLELPNYGQRINLARVGGSSIRYWEPITDPYPETEPGSGAYSASYVIMQVDVDGPIQTITARGIALNVDDFVNEINDTMNRVANDTVPALYPITPGQVSGATSGGSSTPAAPGWDFPHWSTGIDNLAQVNNAYIIVRWVPNTASDNVDFYEIRYSKNADGNYTRVQTASPAALDGNGDAFLKIFGLIQGTSYTFEVRGTNNLGVASSWSSTQAQVSATDATSPAVPTGLAAIKTPRGALVSWNGNTEADLQGYELQVSIGGGGFSLVTPGPTLGTTIAYTAPSGTALGTSLQFQVRAVDWSGNFSAYSASSTAVNTDGIVFDELLVGNLKVFGTITTGGFQTAASGARVVIDSTGIRIYDGTATNYESNAGFPSPVVGVTAELRNDGNAFFQGTVYGSSVFASVVATSGSVGTTGNAGFHLGGSFLDFYTIGSTAEGNRYYFAPDNVTAFSLAGELAAASSTFAGPVTKTVLQLTNFIGLEATTSDGTFGRGFIQTQYSTDANSGQVTGRKARGTMGTPTVIAAGDGVLAITGQGYDGTNWIAGALIGIGPPSTATIAAGSVPMDFAVLLGHSGASLAEIFHLTSTGHWWSNGGVSPTVGALQANVSAQSVAGTDVAFNFSFTIGAGGIGNANVGIVNYGTAFGAIPKHGLTVVKPTVAVGFAYLNTDTTGGVTFTTQDALAGNATGNYNLITIGQS
jgi:hypothetical protein